MKPKTFYRLYHEKYSYVTDERKWAYVHSFDTKEGLDAYIVNNPGVWKVEEILITGKES